MGLEYPDAQDNSLNSTFRATRLEFIILARDDEFNIAEEDDDVELEWRIPEQDTFDMVVGQAVNRFTAVEHERILALA